MSIIAGGQPFAAQISPQSDGTNWNWIFDPPAVGQVWTGSCQIPGVLPNSVLPVLASAFDQSIPIGQWWNSQSSGVLQIISRLTVSVPISQVTGNPGQAFFRGVITPLADSPAVWPEPTPPPPVSGPVVLFNQNNVSLAAGVTTILNGIPVVEGTSLCCTIVNNGPSDIEIECTWGASPSLPVFGKTTFNISATTGVNQADGIIIPNLAPFLTMQINATANSSALIVVQTGLPFQRFAFPEAGSVGGSIGSSPGQLVLASGNVPAGGNTTFSLPPYIGPAVVWAEMIATAANNFDVEFDARTYSGGNFQFARIVGSIFTVFGVAEIIPTQVFLPALINTIKINNRDGVARTFGLSLIGLPDL